MAEEWRVEVHLEDEGHGLTLGDRLKSLDLDNDARKRLGEEVIVTRDPGYLLETAPEQVDIGCFELLVSEARATEDAAARAELLRQALALWRGTPLADLAFEAFTGLEAARLEELRAGARSDLIDTELELGRHAELVPELHAVTYGWRRLPPSVQRTLHVK